MNTVEEQIKALLEVAFLSKAQIAERLTVSIDLVEQVEHDADFAKDEYED